VQYLSAISGFISFELPLISTTAVVAKQQRQHERELFSLGGSTHEAGG
jgi:hypothetical protein